MTDNLGPIGSIFASAHRVESKLRVDLKCLGAVTLRYIFTFSNREACHRIAVASTHDEAATFVRETAVGMSKDGVG
jgi:hypothetical protein